MATVRQLSIYQPDRIAPQGDVKCTVVLGTLNDEKFVQLDTYGSAERQHVGKRSQSIRLTKEAYEQLIELASPHFG